MSKRHETRRLAMQLLYQFDLRGEDRCEEIIEELGDAEQCAEGLSLAGEAWAARTDADSLASRLAPQWPTHRQPPIDRAIVRLAFHEIRSDRVPVGVAINEAVELAKAYGAENSSSFVNGLLDKMAKQMKNAD